MHVHNDVVHDFVRGRHDFVAQHPFVLGERGLHGRDLVRHHALGLDFERLLDLLRTDDERLFFCAARSRRRGPRSLVYEFLRTVSERTPEGWIDLSRAHWAGVENRNHWRRDATLGEDRPRLQSGRALMNLALLRSSEPDEDWLPAKTERLAAHPTSALALLRTRL